MATTISKRIGEGFASGQIYAALAYDSSDKYGGYEIKSMMTNTNYKHYFRNTSQYIYSSASGQLDIVASTVAITGNLTVSGSLTYGASEVPVATNYMGTLTVGINDTGYDVKFYGATSGKYFLWDESADGVVLAGSFTETGNMAVTGTFTLTGNPTITGNPAVTGNTTLTGTLTVGVDNTGHDVKFYTNTSGSYVMVDESEDALLVNGVNTTMTGTLTVGVDNTGHDVKFYGATSGKYFLWDESADSVVLLGNLSLTGNIAQTGNTAIVGTLTVGVDDTGHDVKFYGAGSGYYWLWDEDGTTNGGVVLVGAMTQTGNFGITGNIVITGGDIDLTASTTGTYDLILKANQADALSIKDSTGDLMVFTTTTGALAITVPAIFAVSNETDASGTTTASMKTAGGLGVAKKAYIGTDLVMVGGDIDLTTANTGTYDLILKANQADALSIKDSSGDLMVFTTTTGALAIAISAAVTLTGTLTVGVDGTGHDVKFYGDTSGAYMLWDESANELILAGAATLDLTANKVMVDFKAGDASTKTVGSDAPAGWINVNVDGTKYYIPYWSTGA